MFISSVLRRHIWKLLYLSYEKYGKWSVCIYKVKNLGILTFYSLAVSLFTARFNIHKFYMVLALSSVSCTDLRTDSGLWCIRH